MTTKIPVRTLTIVAREWFDKLYGNTYSTARVVINGTDSYIVHFMYGHGAEMIYSRGIFPVLSEKYDLPASMYDARTAENLTIITDLCEVQRKKDLHYGGKYSPLDICTPSNGEQS